MTKFFEYEYNLFGLDDFDKDSKSRLRFWFEHIRNNALNDDGDIFEFGVFKGASLVAVALLLKEMKSSKKIYGFDSFEGFPTYSNFDDLQAFYSYSEEYFDDDFIKQYENFKKVKALVTGNQDFDKVSIATSLDFSMTSRELVQQKIDYFELDNIELVQGSFEETVPNFFSQYQGNVSSCNIDCDLYDGYRVVLPYIYEQLSENGHVHLDEYFSFKYPGARIACDDFFKEKGITPRRHEVRSGEFERWYFTK